MLKHLIPRSARFLSLVGVALLAACSSTVQQTGSTGTGGGGTGGTGGGGGAKPVTCTWTKETSNATCPGGACPIVLDEALACDDLEFGAPGVRVAPAPDATWVATASSHERHVYRLTNGAEERQDGVPQAFARKTIALALGPDGAVHLAADATEIATGANGALDYEGGATHAALANGAWTSELVFDRSDKYTPVIDLEVGSDGAPKMWIVSDAPDGISVATASGASGWVLAKAPVPPMGGWNRFTLASDGSVVSVAFEPLPGGGEQPHALVGGVDRTIGSAFPDFVSPVYALTAAPAPKAPSGPLFAVAIAYDDGIHVFGERASAPESESVIAGTTAPVATCVTPGEASCGGTCHETASGVEPGAFALAWTDDGTAWLAYVVTKLDQIFTYGLQGDPGVEFCVGNITAESSQATLHIARVPLDGGAPKEALAMPIARPGGADAFLDLFSPVRFVDARGFGKDLAIGVRTGWITGPNAVRVIRIDTTKL